MLVLRRIAVIVIVIILLILGITYLVYTSDSNLSSSGLHKSSYYYILAKGLTFIFGSLGFLIKVVVYIATAVLIFFGLMLLWGENK